MSVGISLESFVNDVPAHLLVVVYGRRRNVQLVSTIVRATTNDPCWPGVIYSSTSQLSVDVFDLTTGS